MMGWAKEFMYVHYHSGKSLTGPALNVFYLDCFSLSCFRFPVTLYYRLCLNRRRGRMLGWDEEDYGQMSKGNVTASYGERKEESEGRRVCTQRLGGGNVLANWAFE